LTMQDTDSQSWTTLTLLLFSGCQVQTGLMSSQYDSASLPFCGTTVLCHCVMLSPTSCTVSKGHRLPLHEENRLSL
jgi:hypothetical protein